MIYSIIKREWKQTKKTFNVFLSLKKRQKVLKVFFSKSKIDIYIAKVETKMWHAPIGYLFPK